MMDGFDSFEAIEVVLLVENGSSIVSERLMQIVHDENLVLSTWKHKNLIKISRFTIESKVQYKFLPH
jgi:hypothetical protein